MEDITEYSCEDCEFYDYDEADDSYACRLSLDEDEYSEMLSSRSGRPMTNTKRYASRYDPSGQTIGSSRHTCPEITTGLYNIFGEKHD